MGKRTSEEQIGVFDVTVTSYACDTPEFSHTIQQSQSDDHWKDFFPDPIWVEDQLHRYLRRDGERAKYVIYSEANILHRMLQARVMLENAIINNDVITTALQAGELGQLIAESKFKFQWELDALRGRKIIDGSSSTRKGAQADRVAAVDGLCANGMKKTAAFATVADQQGVKAKTIETDYYNAKKRS